jgi:hypothetical protein
MAIGISSGVGQEIIKVHAKTAAGLVAFFAMFNGGGRPIFGFLTDAFGQAKRRPCLVPWCCWHPR